MTFSQQMLTGLGAGIAVGLFFGEGAAVLSPLATAFVGLLQMTVLPYVTVSIVSSLGRLDYATAKALAARVGAVILFVWAVVLIVIFLMPLAFPAVESASFFSTTLLDERPPFDFIALYVPSNPFNSLANNIVPAVVLFSVCVGVALIGLERRELLLDVLQVVGDALSRATRFIVRLTPIGLFAIAGAATGTLQIEELGRLQIYLFSYAAIALFLSFWVLPGLVALLTPVPVTAVLTSTRNIMLTAFVAGNLFIVLPSLIEACKALLRRYEVDRASDLPDVVIPAAFNFPHSGKLLAISFILFAGWFTDTPVSPSDYPGLAAAGLVTLFGSANAAVPFLLNLFQLPADTFQLFLATGVVNSRFGAVLAAAHLIALALIGSCAMAGEVRWRAAPAARYVAITIVLAAALVAGGRALFATALAPEYQKDRVLAEMNLLDASVREAAARPAPALHAAAGPVLDRIRERGILRAGYFTDSLPYAFRNRQGDLVGLDIELGYRLARELGVTVEWIELNRAAMADALAVNGSTDIVMSGVAITTERAATLLFSVPYLDETLALLVRDHDREAFATWPQINAMGDIAIGVPDLPYFIEKLHALAPRARLQAVPSVEAALGAGRLDLHAFALPAERGSAWTLMHPQFSVVVPSGTRVRIPLGYPVAARDETFASFINTWIELKQKDGTVEALFDYWVKGLRAAPAKPRWSIIRDVLHWID
jgi:Na+/H+-dicarboxylate symporter/ABC-type amino acid transport substrate-binding protein